MALLILGVLMFAGVHFIPSLAPGMKQAWMRRLGEGGYKGMFSLLLLASFALMIIGWRSAVPEQVYQVPADARSFGLALMCLAFFLLAASSLKSRIKQFVRHPQLTGVALWAAAHLILNGDSRSVVLFGGLALWSIIEIFAISKREGVWVKGAAPSWTAELLTGFAAAITIAIFVFVHPWISGVPVL